MKSNYKKLGHFIRLVDVRNKNLKVKILLGLTINKEFIPSVANTVGTNMANYKIISKNQFACSLMQVRRDKKIPIALLKDFDEAIISQAYSVFEIIDTEKLLPEYLMMWFSRFEFDREACFYAVGGVRGSLEWEDFCEMSLPVPKIERQREIVTEYNTIVKRIKLNERLNKKLEETAQAIYKRWFVKQKNSEWELKSLEDICTLITDGKHGDCKNEINSGYYFISVKDLSNENINYYNARQITKEDFEETHKRTDLKAGDILLTNAGTIGRLAIVKDIPQTKKTTFQKSVAILKPNKNYVSTYFLYSLLKNNINTIKDLAGGSTQSNLLLGDLRRFEFLLPKEILIKKFEEKTEHLFGLIELKQKETKQLFLIRNLLLSKMTKI